ncbi:hypothetical protein CONCODRAFT_77660 [Conidiobolus coronatus NRRL 28638]|uniref:Uncharacterized protein n=1 Tax=Conidiobolus coronatus (strain ATCC 28846 / CBS 209.66 / NRRL 28638) TaxID=796925 RepID=A0A137PCK0_CONC2|nr:hypothetical protein CONCODRAFT_77660 [Conidiobolus coronatus NRRL 28638]|eukprot:KXN72713.1 hypothetical protein CONCODRAFT_77660 [Conidiobolus coronatus NRRL 28638]
MNTQIPKGFAKFKSESNEVFNVENLTSNDKELWLLRVPEHFNISKLSGRTFKIEDLQGAIPTIVDDLQGHRVIERSFKPESDNIELDQNLGEEAEQLACLLPSTEDSKQYEIVEQKFDRIFHLVRSVDVPNTDKLAQDLLKEPFVPPQQPPQIYSESNGVTVNHSQTNGTPSKKAKKNAEKVEDSAKESKHKSSKSKKSKKSKQ